MPLILNYENDRFDNLGADLDDAESIGQSISNLGENKEETKNLRIFLEDYIILVIVFFMLYLLFLFFTSHSSYEALNEFSIEIWFIIIILPVLLFGFTATILIFPKPKKRVKDESFREMFRTIIERHQRQIKTLGRMYDVDQRQMIQRLRIQQQQTQQQLRSLTAKEDQIQEFKVNDFITLKLRRERTEIYVNGAYFRQCMFLLLNIPKEEIDEYNTIESIDEAMDIQYSSKDSRELENASSIQKEEKYQLTPEVEFQGHCSNLQAWYENEYDTRLLHSNLAFPLLKKLTEVGDPLAKKVFKEEIALRFESGYPNVITFLIEKGYLDLLEDEEIKVILNNTAICQKLKNCNCYRPLEKIKQKIEKRERLLRQARNRAKKYKFECPI